MTTTLDTLNTLADDLIERAGRGDPSAFTEFDAHRSEFEEHFMSNTVAHYMTMARLANEAVPGGSIHA